MEIASSFTIETWKKIFDDFRQIESVRVNISADKLDIKIIGNDDILTVTREALDDTLYKYKGNPKEVATFFLKENGIVVYYQDTIVGFFDIIGYSSFISTLPIEEAIYKVKRFLDDAGRSAGTDFGPVKLDHWILSDSIILVVDTNRHPLFTGSLDVFLGTCSSILQDGMRHGLPLRGAIGGGTFYKDGELMVSSALVDAAKYEKEQDWFGAVLTPDAHQAIERAKDFEIRENGSTGIDLLSNRFEYCIRFGEIPWKIRESGLEQSREAYYIKPEMAEVDWDAKYLPEHLQVGDKIINSHCLYGLE